mmetsp:Transcript_39625/g.55031  ORF Transcript_39625/g.55031 Transcript_39625/m.55031 type:complete len:132 (-) Transcript_39625:336-731(-)|eukprot:CAMPEP_0196581278 /NCGR_PEP_ID=MMETSP1081-20130531/33349_1 /TAXON_ID=36882 /ORGANISM="Pyramimonas amylifera, Strain CCMP720" /LENGTH=131 /DNA_ID=CAMNT_0041901451 /DNA_START=209 /DNA_END=604 /DNA_ORIENTATION=-
MSTADNRGITFDEFYRIRVLDPERFQQTEQLKEECSAFTDRVSNLSTTVKTLVDAVDQQAERIENEKLRALGKRNQASTEHDSRRRKKKEMDAIISEKKFELERINVEFESLKMVKREQELLIAKLSDSSI